MPGFDTILTNTLQHEGGETTDTGGHTNYGITQKTFDNYADRNNIARKNVKGLKYGEVRSVYEKDFYKGPKIDQLPSEKLKGVVFDYAVNSGPSRAIRDLQDIVGVKSDGKLGAKTLEAVNDFIASNGEDLLSNMVLNSRAGFMNNLVMADPQKYGEYQNGWMNRIRNLKQQYNLNGPPSQLQGNMPVQTPVVAPPMVSAPATASIMNNLPSASPDALARGLTNITGVRG
jgi:lysozyme family protein